MANIKYNFSSGNNGTVHYNADILNNIVRIAVKEVEGVYGLTPGKGIRLSFDKEGVDVTVSVIAEYGNSVPELAYRIQASIKQAVESMTRYKVTKVDVHVQEVIFPEEEEALAATAKDEDKE
jgi:uncharacterized alkaline shock family protein YloU